MAEKKMIRLLAVFFLSLTVLVVTGLFYLPVLRGALSDYFSKTGNSRLAEFFSDEEALEERKRAVVIETEQEAGEEDSSERLVVALPEKAYTSMSDMSVAYDPLTKTLSLVIPGADEEYLSLSPVSGPSRCIEEINAVPGDPFGTIDIRTDRVYEISCHYDSSSLFIDFLDPHEVYDYVVTIDPGHGGDMPGTVKGGYSEKDINLAIALKLKKLLEDSDMNIGVYCTRTTDVDVDFPLRASLANDSISDVFISIHNNSLSGRGKNVTSGVMALYNTKDGSGRSQKLSEALTEAVSSMAGAVNCGIVSGDDIYIVANSQVVVSLVEVGFMTNPAELKLLVSDKYQQQVAEALCSGIEEWLKGSNPSSAAE